MADISILSRLVSGQERNVDISANTLVTTSVKVGGGVSNTELTKAILDRLVNLQNGSDVDATYHTHDGRYFTETEIGQNTGTTGSDLVGDDNTYSNFTPAAATVKGALSGIDSALGSISGFAHTNLDNLAATTLIAQDLLLATDEAKSLGSSTKRWLALWAHSLQYSATQGIIDLSASMLQDETAANALSYKVRQAFDASAAISIDWAARQLKSGATVKLDWSGTNIDVNGRKITGGADPTAAQDFATKAYVDAVALGLAPKKAVRVATTAAGTLASSFENGDTVDGVTLATGDRILIKDQAAPEENGIYTVNASGAPTRATDFDSLSPIDEINGAWVPVQFGTVNAGRIYVQYGTVATIGTDPINFEFYNPIASLIGGDMITVSGSTISVDLAAVSGLESSNPGNAAGQLRVKLEASNPSLQINGSNELGAKLDASGAVQKGASGLFVGVDDSTIERNANALRVKDAGITLAKLASDSVDENKIVSTAIAATGALDGGSGTKLSVRVDDSSIEKSSNNLRVKSTAYDQVTITGGSGSAAAVQQSPLMKRTLVAGESFAANTSFLVRWALTGETAGRVYKADKDASSVYKYAAIGVALSTSAVSAGQNIDVTLMGEHTLGSSDSAFASGDVGKELFVGTSGAFILGSALANTTNEAQFVAGAIQATNKIWVDFKQLRGIA